MPDPFYLVSRWWKQMLALILLSLAVVTIVLFLKPAKYLSESTALPASTFASDKASVFNNNIQALYPTLGTTDDLDMIVGTGQLDTVYIAISEEFNLADHYRAKEQGRAAIQKGASQLKKNSKVIKSEFGELKVKVWDHDKMVAPQLANAIINKLQAIHQDLQNSQNLATLTNLQSGREKITGQIDSITNFLQGVNISSQQSITYTSRLSGLSEQLQQYEKLIDQYRLITTNKPPALIIVEKARAANWPDKPRKLQTLAATFVLALLFSFAAALLLEKRKSARK